MTLDLRLVAPPALSASPASPASLASPALPAPQPASPPPHPGFCLLDRFCEFYLAVIQERRQILTGTSGSASSGSSPWSLLLRLLQSQEAAARKAEAAEAYREAEYLMAVLADEVFLGLLWPGRSAWNENPLELALFGTRNGATVVFEKIDALLARGARMDDDMARTYLLAMGVGFHGRYAGREEVSHLDAYRERLYRALYGAAPGTIPGPGRLFPDAYLSTASQGKVRRLPALRPWVAVLLSTLILLTIFSYRLWRDATADVRGVVEEILELP